MKSNKNIEDLKDWQSKQYSPGHFIGTGKVPRPMSGLSRFPKVLVCIGVFFLIFSLLCIFDRSWLLGLINLCLSIAFIYGGIIRIISKKK